MEREREREWGEYGKKRVHALDGVFAPDREECDRKVKKDKRWTHFSSAWGSIM
jgi:hypothetical protein